MLVWTCVGGKRQTFQMGLRACIRELRLQAEGQRPSFRMAGRGLR